MSSRCVFLIGFMASGKSRIGKLLARVLGCRFADTDALIEQREGRSIPEIFRRSGEPYFRRLERDMLVELGPRCDSERLVIAAGGGMPCTGENLRLMKEHGVVVFLEVSMEDIAERIGGDRTLLPGSDGQAERPLATGRSAGDLRALYRKREKYYRQADITVKNPGTRSPGSVARQIAGILKEGSPEEGLS